MSNDNPALSETITLGPASFTITRKASNLTFTVDGVRINAEDNVIRRLWSVLKAAEARTVDMA